MSVDEIREALSKVSKWPWGLWGTPDRLEIRDASGSALASTTTGVNVVKPGLTGYSPSLDISFMADAPVYVDYLLNEIDELNKDMATMEARHKARLDDALKLVDIATNTIKRHNMERDNTAPPGDGAA